MGEAGHRAQIDDRRVGVLAQIRMREAAHLERGYLVRLDQGAHFVFAVVQRFLAHIGAGVVHQQRQLDIEVGDPVEYFQTLLALRDIGGKRENLALGKFLGQISARLLQMRFVTCNHQHIGAKRGEFARTGQTNALAGAGDQAALAVQTPTGQVRRHRHPPRRL